MIFGVMLLQPVFTYAGEIKWSGFMSVVAGKMLEDDQTSYESYDDDILFSPESMIGLQGQALISDNFRGTLQVVGKGGNDDYNAQVEWAYVSYDVTNDLTVNAGRFRIPLYY